MNETLRHNHLTVRFPHLMGHVPGGVYYDMEHKTLTERAHDFIILADDFAKFCNNHGVSAVCGVQLEPINLETFATQLSYSVNLRKMRNSWKKVMRKHGWDCSDPMWRRADGRDHDIWGDEWVKFRKMVFKLTNQVLTNAK